MTPEIFSKKQLCLLNWWCDKSPYKSRDSIICDGAVRSGKTLCMSLSFVLWAFSEFCDESFALTGKTVTSLRRNLITPLISLLKKAGFTVEDSLSRNVITLSYKSKTNRFYLFGGRDESSASLIQGVTLAGVLFDEVALMPRSFVEQALARCSVSGSRYWFNCNPDNPAHWFYREWIKKTEEKNCLYLHFTMKDNPSLSPAVRRRYERLYSGTFYQRFIEGRWVAAEGAVYPFFGENQLREPPPPPYDDCAVSCDYGTVNPASFGLWVKKEGLWYRVKEYYYDSRREGSQRTDEEHYASLCQLCEGYSPRFVTVDPSAASFMECIRRHGQFNVTKAKNDVVDGIRRVSDALKNGEIFISPECKDSIREFSLYVWEQGGAKDSPRKENDHAMDDIRCFVTATLDREEDFFALSVPRDKGQERRKTSGII